MPSFQFWNSLHSLIQNKLIDVAGWIPQCVYAHENEAEIT